MDSSGINKSLSNGSFPNPLASPKEKAEESYGLRYAKAIEAQWDLTNTSDSVYALRIKEFDEARDYAAGRQSTQIYKQILSANDPNDNDGTLLNLDWRPVPIIPKYVNIIVNKTLDRNPKPNLEAIDPVSLTEKDNKKAQIRAAIENRDLLIMAKEAGLQVDIDIDALPESTDEFEIYKENNVKTDAEIAGQLGASMTLTWNNFNEKILRRLVDELVVVGMCVPYRFNDPTYGITIKYVKPEYFVHSYTEDPTFSDITYAGHIEQITIGELKRLAGDKFTAEDYHKIASLYRNKYENKPERLTNDAFNSVSYVNTSYDEYIIDILHFQFKTTETNYFEEKANKHGTKGFYYKGNSYKKPENSVFERTPHSVDFEVTYSGVKIMNTDYIVRYGKDFNMPRNVHDISRTNLSYFPIAVNLRNMMPTSTVAKIRGFADILQLAHLKWQQALAKAKSDGLAIDINALESVDLGTGGAMNPLDLQDIYEKTGVFYYRSKMIDGERTGRPVEPIPNQIRVINEIAATYNQYLNMIRDVTGVNEAMDGSSPKGEQLVGVREQAIQSGNNAIYDITVAMKLVYKRVVEDIVKCLQVLPKESILYKNYENAIGKYNMKVLNSFKELSMVNFGVDVVLDMDEAQRAYMEMNVQQSLAQKEIDLEDAIAIRNMDDIDQAEQLLIIRRRKRMKHTEDVAMQNIQAQTQANNEAAMAKMQAEVQKEQMLMQMEMQKKQAEHQMELEKIAFEYDRKMQLAQLELGVKNVAKQSEVENQKELERKREEAKDKRIDKQAALQSQMIDQRKGTAPRIQKPMDGTEGLEGLLTQ
jgi:Tfp pilus assembly protein PilV